MGPTCHPKNQRPSLQQHNSKALPLEYHLSPTLVPLLVANIVRGGDALRIPVANHSANSGLALSSGATNGIRESYETDY